jgi:hypothetical protein
MSLFDSIARASLNPALLSTFGERVVYRRGDGVALSIEAIVGPYDGELEYLERGRETTETRRLTVLRDAYNGITEPQEDVDEVTIKGVLWRVKKVESATATGFVLVIERVIRESVSVRDIFGK